MKKKALQLFMETLQFLQMHFTQSTAVLASSETPIINVEEGDDFSFLYDLEDVFETPSQTKKRKFE